jgi:hypothetical protein
MIGWSDEWTLQPKPSLENKLYSLFISFLYLCLSLFLGSLPHLGDGDFLSTIGSQELVK